MNDETPAFKDSTDDQTQSGQTGNVTSEEFVPPPNLIPAGSSSITADMLPLVKLEQQHIDSILQIVPGGANNVQDIYPLSPLQEGMLFHCLLNEQHDTYVQSTLFELESREHLSRLVDAIQRVIDRHDVLRTAVLWESLPQPVQVVLRRSVLPVEEVQLNLDRELRTVLKKWTSPAYHSLDLRKPPLTLLQVTADPRGGRWYAVLRIHHLLCDHQSLRAVVAEVMHLINREEWQLRAPAPFRNYVARVLATTRAEAAEGFFRSKIGHIDEPTAPFGVADTHDGAGSMSEFQRELEPALARDVRTQARRLGVTTARLFHAAWAVVVAHTSDREEVVFGTVLLAARQQSGAAQRTLGMAVNTLPLRLQLRDVSTEGLVRHTHEELVDLRKHQDVSLTLALRSSGVAVASSLFTSLLNFRHSAGNRDHDPTSASGVRVLERGEAWTNYPVTVIVDDLGEGFALTVQTVTCIDPQQVAGHLVTAVAALVETLERAPNTPALSLSILSSDERRRLLSEFNATRARFDHDKLIHQLFEEQVERTPHAVAVEFEGKLLTYAELNARSNQLARHLRDKGIGPDRVVGISIERSCEMVIGLFGILKAGAAYVPIDPSYPPERLAYMLEDAAPKVLLTQSSLKRKLPAGTVEAIALDSDWDAIAVHGTGNLDPAALGLTSRHLAYVIYTSGSTGRPKGAMNEHRALINRLQWMQHAYQLGEQDRVLQKTPFSFDVSVWEFFWTLMSGARLIVARPRGHQDPDYLLKLIEEAGVTLLHFVPSMLQVFLDAHRPGQCRSLRRVVCSGEELSAGLQRKFFEHFPNAQLANLYGPTEAAIDVTGWECRKDDQEIRVPIGRPIWNTHIYVLNRRGEPTPLGVPGEIHIGGEGVGRGYWNREELTQERFVHDPFATEPHARVYKTGDLGRWRPDGAIEYLGRNDHQVKIRGFRVELGEIEAQLSKHAQVKEATVLARDDAAHEKHLVAYVVPIDAIAAPSIEDLRGHLQTRVPEFMVPTAFVTLERMPLTPNGKLDRRALPAPASDAYARQAYEPPQGEVEEILAGIWQSLLRVDRIGRHDNFFELGGHSLLIVQMRERLRQFGLSTDLRRVFEHPVLKDLASVLTDEAAEHFDVPSNLIEPGCSQIMPQMLPLLELDEQHIETIVRSVPEGVANVQDIYPLAPLQEGILFHHLLREQRGDTYVIPIVLSVSSRERLDKLIAALQALIDRHDILRTAVLWERLPRPVQVVYRRALLPVEEISLELNPEDQIHEWMKVERQRMDLRRAPLMRMQIARQPNSEEWYVLWQLHHIVDDATSREILFSELVAYLEGRGGHLSQAVSYRGHVAQSLAYARVRDAEAFFRRKLGDVTEPTAPFALLDALDGGGQIREASEDLDPLLARRVREQSRRHGVSAATFFHAAFALVVAQTSGREDVVFGSVLLGRLLGTAETQRILGMLINTLPLRLTLSGVNASELLIRVQRELVELLAHEHASLALAQRCSGIEGATPLFTALLNYRHNVKNIDLTLKRIEGVRLLATRVGTNYPITLSIDDLGEGFALTAQTQQRIDPRRLLGYLSEATRSLLDSLESASQRPACSLSILPRLERMEVLEQFNATQMEYSRHRLIHELFEEQVKRSPAAIAIEHEQHSLSYAQLNAQANRLARRLRERRAGPDRLVAVCIERGLEMVVALIGILKAGAAYVPLDPNYPRERLAYMLTDSEPQIVVTQRKLLPMSATTAADVVVLDEAVNDIPDGADENLLPNEAGTNSSNLLYVIYTSGSTGRPKGTAMSHAAMMNLLEWHQKELPLRGGERVLQFAALSFDVAFQEVFSTLCGGGTLVLVDEWVRKDPRALMEFLAGQSIERLFVPPLMLQGLAESYKATGLSAPSLRDVIAAGEQLRISREIINLFSGLEGCRLHNHYGPTETHVVTALTLQGDPSQWPALPTIGRPIANTQIYILDSNRNPVPVAVPGEIYIAGASLATGYLKRSELTAERFVRDPFAHVAHARMYRVGDLGRWCSDGTIEYLGRNDEQVKIRGFRVELGEIEAQLGVHEHVKEAAVIIREDVPGMKRLVAYVTARGEDVPSAEQLRTRLESLLPGYMVPSAFVVLDRLPLTPSGKLNRRALPEPDKQAYARDQYDAPASETERVLAEIWRRLLRVEQIGRDDDFFHLGGHSLLAMQLVARVQSTFSVDLPIRHVFERSTLRQMAGAVDEIHHANLLKQLSSDAHMADLLEQVEAMSDGKAQQALQKLHMEVRP